MYTCMNCGSEFTPKKPSHRQTPKFCGRPCMHEYKKKHPEYWGVPRERFVFTCAQCGNEFERTKSKIRAKGEQYCSMRCTILARSVTIADNPELLDDMSLRIKTCEWCGKEYTVDKPSHAPRRRYCSENCARRSHKYKMRGENNPNYRHGKNRRSAYLLALRHHESKCMICGWDIAVEVHHITPRSEDGTNRLENLAVLCPNHHKMADLGLLDRDELRTMVANMLANTP